MRTSVAPHGDGFDVRSAAGLLAHYRDHGTAQSVAARLDGRLDPDLTLPTTKLKPLNDEFPLGHGPRVVRNGGGRGRAP